jgi:hypothetical protein
MTTPARLFDPLSEEAGHRCRHCGEPVRWRGPGAVAFHDNTAAHVACYERAEVSRLLAAGQRALAGAYATSDNGEILTVDDAE